jgi:HK97 family phage major capsid protein
MLKLNELRQLAADIGAEAEWIMDAAIADGREMSADEEKKVAALEAQLEKVNGDIRIAEDLADRRSRLKPVSRGNVAEMEREPQRAGVNLPKVSREVDPTGGFANLGEFAMAVMRANPQNAGYSVDQRLGALYQSADPTGYHREAGSTEGFMVPPEFRNQIWDLVFGDENLITQTDIEPTAANQVEWLADEATPWGGGGITARWRTEASQMSPQQISTATRMLALHELYCFVTATDELLEDAPRLNARLTGKAAQAIAWTIDDTVIWGNGVGKPLGYMNSPALVTVAKESGQAADSVTVMNFANMFSRMIGGSIGRAQWLMNSDVLPQLIGMTLNGHPIWTPPATGIAGAPGGMLLGRPVKLSEHCKSLGDKGDIQLVDLKGFYAARKASGLKFASSIHLYFDYGIQAFRWTIKLGGQPHLSAPISPAHGSSTKSHFVTLAERA